MPSIQFPCVIPRPVEMRVSRKGVFVLGPDTAIISNAAAEPFRADLRDTLQRATGIGFQTAKVADGQTISLTVDPALFPKLHEEGYTLAVNSSGVSLAAATGAGMFYAVQTLMQLLPPAIFGGTPRVGFEWKIPYVKIVDHPRFHWRGAMLDVARHFMPVEFVKKFLDLMALHKLNTFHWHLTDDQGWRIEIKKYPRLTETGAWRAETRIGHQNASGGGDGIPHGGFYTQQEIRDIVAYAAARNITIVPEIDMPGHMQAAIASYPELGCLETPVSVGTGWGVYPHILNVSEETILFMQNVLAEVMDLFPGKFIHVGGDEAEKMHWKASEAMHARMREVGAGDFDGLQSWFIRRMEEFLTANGRRLVGWDEILEGGLAPNATVMAWRNENAGVTAALAGHDAVMAPSSHTYLDNYQSPLLAMEPIAIHGVLPLEKVYGYNPVAESLDTDAARHILGVQCQLWSEYLTRPEKVEYMAFPRMCALSEVAWSQASRKDYRNFLVRLEIHLKRLDVLGVRYRPLDRISRSKSNRAS